jgi:hypothetical protein
MPNPSCRVGRLAAALTKMVRAPCNTRQVAPVRWCLGVVALAFALSCPAQGTPPVSFVDASNVCVAVYLKTDPLPVAIVRAGAIHEDYQRRGFFRIGVLPMLALERLTLEVRDPEHLSGVLTNATAFLARKGEARKAVEGRDFALSFTCKPDGRVTARSVRLEGREAWSLAQGTVDMPPSKPVNFRRATLTISGPQGGDLLCETSNGPVRISLHSSLSNHKP